MERHQEIERSLIKKFRKPIWNRFVAAIKDYKLILPGDHIAVCISGGKDSMMLAKCMQHLHKYSEIPFELKFLVMDPGYRKDNLQQVKENAALLDIPIRIFTSDIFQAVSGMEGSPCYICARMRRGHLYSYAREMGCNKIALGHHFDDAIETALLSVLYGAEFRTMMPKLHSTNFEGMELIRPLYQVRERDIISWARYNSLSFIRCACRFTEATETDLGLSKRLVVKELIKTLRADNPQVDVNIFQSLHNVNLQTVIGYQKDGIRYSFLEEYDRNTAIQEDES